MAKIEKVFVRSAYNYDRSEVSRETGSVNEMEDMCKQSFKDECDINTIVKRFNVTGLLPQSAKVPRYDLFENVIDFHTAMNAIAEARESFDMLPAEVRAKFQNDPGKFVDFCSKKENLPEMRKLGLAIPEVLADNDPAADVPPKKESGDVDKRGSDKGGAVKDAKASGAAGEAAKGE